MNPTKLIRILERAGVIDTDKTKSILYDGTMRKVRECGEDSYRELCRIFDVPPHEPPRTPMEIKRSLEARLKTRIALRKKEIRKIEQRLTDLAASSANNGGGATP